MDVAVTTAAGTSATVQGDQYTYMYAFSGAGTRQQFTLTLNDGTTHLAGLQFK